MTLVVVVVVVAVETFIAYSLTLYSSKVNSDCTQHDKLKYSGNTAALNGRKNCMKVVCDGKHIMPVRKRSKLHKNIWYNIVLMHHCT